MCVSLCLSVFIGVVMIGLSLLPHDYELKQSWWRDLFARKKIAHVCIYTLVGVHVIMLVCACCRLIDCCRHGGDWVVCRDDGETGECCVCLVV